MSNDKDRFNVIKGMSDIIKIPKIKQGKCKTRKHYNCDFCGKAIPKGTMTEYAIFKYAGQTITNRLCDDCTTSKKSIFSVSEK